MPNYTSDWTTPHVKLWDEHLKHLKGKAGIIGLEIGIFEGRSTNWFLDNILTGSNTKIICIDTFQMTNSYDIFDKNVDHSEKVELMIGRSDDRLKEIEKETISFAYIDGDHTPIGALKDAVMVFDLMKHDGIMIFDDYNFKDDYSDAKPGIDAFLNVYSKELEVLHKGDQVIVRRK